MKHSDKPTSKHKPYIKVYQGYGHTGNMVVYGHVFKKEPSIFKRLDNGLLSNFVQLLRLFFVRPIASAQVMLYFQEQVLAGQTEYDGFFKFEWASATELKPGWHEVRLETLLADGRVGHSTVGSVLVPHITQFAFISDIDDTVMKSYSATVFRRLYELLARNLSRRRIFVQTVNHYKFLSLAQTTTAMPNPIFYVSSSEWNLYDYLQSIFRHNQLPEGVFLLNQIKRWYQLFTSGRTGHDGKLMRISRVLQAFPKQRFVLIGDNTQRDPEIYTAIAKKHPEQIYAIYIRNVRSSKLNATTALLNELAPLGIHTAIFKKSSEAINHGRQIGLIE